MSILNLKIKLGEVKWFIPSFIDLFKHFCSASQNHYIRESIIHWSVLLPGSHTEALTHNVTSEKVFKEVIKVKWSHKGGVLIL